MELKTLPLHLSDITLEKYVGWNETYGQDLLKASKDLITPEDRLLFETDFYSKHYAWYSDTPYEDVYNALNEGADFYVDMLKIAAESQLSLSRELIDLQEVDLVNAVFDWDGHLWKIRPPVEIMDEAKITVGEFEKIQDVALILSDLQDGKISALYELCEQYLHTISGQIPTNDYTKKLPLSIAKCVQRYLQDTINLFKTLQHDTGTATS